MLLRTNKTVDAERVHLVAKLCDGFQDIVFLVLELREVQILFRVVNFADAVTQLFPKS